MRGVFNGLFGRSTTPAPSPLQSLEATVYPGGETLEVVGESFCQDALWAIVGGRRLDPIRYETYAVLLPNPDNEYDVNAIEVRIDGQLVGHLSREDAVRYHAGLLQLMATSANHLVALHAVIAGGGQRGSGLGFLGVFLDHDPADFGLAPHHTSKARLRTGRSEAMATDIVDNGYDLSWYAQISQDDVTAGRQLRALLQSAQDPIDRHYIFCELEHRLYRSRNTIASALDEFDAVC